MEEKKMQVRNDHPRRSQKRRRKRFPWGDIVATLLVVAICVYVFMSVGVLAESTQPTLSDIDWNLVLVNHENAIPENYEINLVEVAGGEKVDERIYDPLMEMLEAAKEGNWDQLPMVVSGYRTQAKQQKLFDDKVAKYQNEGHSKSEAEEMAKRWVAVPGYSEHQIGLAVDINGATYDLYFWLQKNSYKYGFIFRYPGYKTGITHVAEEVWHYRYVGVEAATEMYEKGLCLEEYLAEKHLVDNIESDTWYSAETCTPAVVSPVTAQ